eukprot:3278068-Amphidinium_carterae.1
MSLGVVFDAVLESCRWCSSTLFTSHCTSPPLSVTIGAVLDRLLVSLLASGRCKHLVLAFYMESGQRQPCMTFACLLCFCFFPPCVARTIGRAKKNR